MQSQNDSQRHIWLLAGTSEGPWIAKTLTQIGWRVSVSVVTKEASYAYSAIALESMWIGALDGIQGIRKVLERAQACHKKFEVVIDATHPFAVLISSNLGIICNQLNTPLIRYERPTTHSDSSNLINKIEEIPLSCLNKRRILLAIGSRHLSRSVNHLKRGNADVFARVLPSSSGVNKALRFIDQANLAVLHPINDLPLGLVERQLCKRWSIEIVICRQSGGIIQSIWEGICKEEKIKLYMLSRPSYEADNLIFEDLTLLIARISDFYLRN